jgi:phage repressor protein C with HTH and peptisase S24 domain
LNTTDIQTDKIGSRLKQIRISKGMTIEEFYKPVTDHTSNCSAIETGKRNLGKRLAKDIIELYQLNAEWLRTGEGEVYSIQSESGSDDSGVPFFNVNLAELSFEDTNLFTEVPEYYVNFRPFNDCDAYLPIYGDSMYPRYASGEVIVIREIINFDIIQWGEAYLVIGDKRANNIATVKLLFEHPDNNKIILRSSNPNFKGDTILDKDFIKKLFIVKGKITRNQL